LNISWRKIPRVDRNCWYWAFWNKLIEKGLSKLDQDRYLIIKTHEMDIRIDEINHFIGVDQFNYKITRSNRAKYPMLEINKWPDRWSGYMKKWCLPYWEELKNNLEVF
jgi:hypothetical protein